MSTQDMLHAFSGIERLYGTDALTKLRQSHVLIIGVGGVGSWAAEALVRSGIGKMTLCDLDEICQSNINRQIHSLASNIGQSKTKIMSERLVSINPQLVIHTIDDFVTRENYESILSQPYDFVFDAIDQVWIKCRMIQYAFINKIPFLSAGASGGIDDPSGIVIEDLNRCTGDPLLRFVRSNLKNRMGLPKKPHKKWRIPVVYTPNITDRIRASKRFKESAQVGCEWSKKDETLNHGLSCDSIGSVVFVTGTMGFVAASYIIRRILQ